MSLDVFVFLHATCSSITMTKCQWKDNWNFLLELWIHFFQDCLNKPAQVGGCYSGASTSVLSHNSVAACGAVIAKENASGFRAAHGSETQWQVQLKWDSTCSCRIHKGMSRR